MEVHNHYIITLQACDRIYRVGQTRDVTIHKFLCEDTVERRILDLQQKKLDLANDVLTGAKRVDSNKLTLEDLKSLFSINSKPNNSSN